MKILMVNGSPRKGETRAALEEMGKVFTDAGADWEIVDLGAAPVNDCVACRKCTELKKCAIGGDIVNELIEKAKSADGFVFGTPVYYAHPTGRILSVLDRAFYAGKYAFMHKPGAAITSLRRAGSCASMDVMNKYFTISEMPIVSSSYWNDVFRPSEAESDAEGLSRELALLALDGCEDVVLVPVDLRLAEGAAALAALDRLYAAIFNCEVRCVAVVTEPPSGCPADLLGFHDVPVGHSARKGAAA